MIEAPSVTVESGKSTSILRHVADSSLAEIDFFSVTGPSGLPDP